ncbi:MAG: hypothetical protein R3Y47_13005 [Lachnospiraceae bacterium]
MSRKIKNIDPVITVNTVFVGTQTDSQAFIDLIAQKQMIDKKQVYIDNIQISCYTDDTSKKQNTQLTGGKI